jgi:hypothetical protein
VALVLAWAVKTEGALGDGGDDEEKEKKYGPEIMEFPHVT